MTLVDRPLVQYAIDEARAAGIKEFIFVTSRGKSALEDYFDHSPVLEQELRRKGKNDLLELLKTTNMDSGAIAYIRQHKALGLGHAVWCARRLIGNEPFAVMLPDDVIAAETPCLQQMVEAMRKPAATWWPRWRCRPSAPLPMACWTCRKTWDRSCRSRAWSKSPSRKRRRRTWR
ncbi:sugar phosphate nucleotidyltransferase [Pseudooceanicola sp.]|uniref:sugar phosphate nucleotidyltransferase n=1 Tax=Pseudooceanicola sp. TaxID=1914328 RepID=UPI003510F1B0